jgi:hypothetical protein
MPMVSPGGYTGLCAFIAFMTLFEHATRTSSCADFEYGAICAKYHSLAILNVPGSCPHSIRLVISAIQLMASKPINMIQIFWVSFEPFLDA